MGGKNHQPCSSYLKNSTRLSRFLSLATVRLETANVRLEDVILCELDGETGDTAPIIENLRASIDELNSMSACVADLRGQMDENGYEDLPSLKTVDLAAVGDSLVTSQRVDQIRWNEAQEIMCSGGFYRMLDTFDERIAMLRSDTERLITQIEIVVALPGQVHRVLEENRVGNIRPAFAKLYTGWHNFHALFLASALISTELWYSFNNFGSLTDDLANRRVA
ncbi:MAG: hypothetical protein AAB337_00955 [Patescibacteria group bacterium]